jgi:serine/threonine-protein kinase
MSAGWPTDRPDVTTSELARLVEVCDHYEAARKAGRDPRIEDLLGAASRTERTVLLRLLLELELDLRAGEGESPTREEYKRRFPDQSGLIDSIFAAELGAREKVPAPDDRELRVTLTVTEGPHTGRAFPFEEHDSFLLGREKDAHFRLPQKDEYLSRHHFLVELNPPACRLIDLESTNGTYLNGRRVESVELRHGDQIRAGTTVLTVAITEVEEGRKTPGPVPEPAPMVAPGPARARSPQVAAAEAAREACRACTAPVEGPGRDDSHLCAACRELADRQPQPIDGYRIVRELGKGAMGVVYLALRRHDGTPVALKTILPAIAASKVQVARFLREARILCDLDHPRIVAFRDMGEAGDLLYFAMDYVRGTDAAKLLQDQGGSLPIGRALGLVLPLLDALAYAHARGFVHRDVKPSNLLVVRDEGRETVKLADFGLARTYRASRLSGLTLPGEIGGTLAYVAPEQITRFRESEPGVDQYAAAATLYHLLTGRILYDFEGPLSRRIVKILQEDPVPIQARRADLSPGLCAVIHRALGRDPKDRFPDVAALRVALTPFA